MICCTSEGMTARVAVPRDDAKLGAPAISIEARTKRTVRFIGSILIRFLTFKMRRSAVQDVKPPHHAQRRRVSGTPVTFYISPPWRVHSTFSPRYARTHSTSLRAGSLTFSTQH